MPPMVQLGAGTVIGSYRVVEFLGEGARGVVYRVHQAVMHRDLALKVARGAEPKSVFHEAKVLARLDHLNIVGVFDAGSHEGSNYLVRTFVDGSTLAALRGEIPLAPALELVVSIASAIDHVHANGLVHGNINGHDILVAADGSPFLSGFSGARIREGGGEAQQSIDLSALIDVVRRLRCSSIAGAFRDHPGLSTPGPWLQSGADFAGALRTAVAGSGSKL